MGMRDVYIGLVREYETAVIEHDKAYRKFVEAGEGNAQFAETDLLHKGSTASHAGGKLEGFVMGLAMLAYKGEW